MLYIVTALKPEAQAFVDRYKLGKKTLGTFKIFQNSEITLIVSGIGINNSRSATQTLINHCDITDDDIYLNIGICGAKKSYIIGELLNISTIVYDGISYQLNKQQNRTIQSLHVEAITDEFDIVDMESFGFYDAVIHSPAIKNRYILKVVSDNFEPQTVTKEKTKMLIFNAIDDINSIIYNKEET